MRQPPAPSLGERLLCLFFPARCLGCGAVVYPEEFFCGACRANRPEGFCFRRLDLPAGSLPVASPLAYTGGYRRALQQYKFSGYKGDAGRLGRLMVPCAEALGLAFDGVTYVPLSRGGRKKRGYDQSRLLAKAVAKSLGLPLLDVLEKARETKIQHQLGREERAQNVRGAYRATGSVAGRTLLLIDDIVTTGATLTECAGALYRAGAKAVGCLCAADAPGPEPERRKQG